MIKSKITNSKYIRDDISTNDVFMAMIGIGNNTMSLGIGMVNLAKENTKLQLTDDIEKINKNILDIKEDMSFAFGMLLTDLNFFVKNSDVAQNLLAGTRIADTFQEIFTEYHNGKTVNLPDIATVASDITNLISNFKHIAVKVIFGAISQVFAFLGNLASADEQLGGNIHIDDLWSVLVSSEISLEELKQALEKTLDPFKQAVSDYYDGVQEWIDAYREDNIALIGDENGVATNDYMEGNWKHNTIKGLSGNDIMNGKAGNDYLYGGTGNDIFIGDEGNDILIDNEGFDTYHIHDHDTIYDADDQGRIVFADIGVLPNQFNKLSDGIWVVYDGKDNITHTATKSGQNFFTKDGFTARAYKNSNFS